MKYLILILLFLISSYFSFSQSNSTPFSQDTILFNAITKRTSKPLPFDRPFIIMVDKLDFSRINIVYAYQISYNNGKRDLTHDSKDANKTPISFPDIKVDYDTSSGKLILFMPALRPNINFDINIQQAFSDKSLNLFYKLIEDIYKSDPNEGADEKLLHARFTQKIYPTLIGSLKFIDVASFTTKIYTPISTTLTKILTSGNYSTCNQINPSEIKHTYDLLSANKNSCNQLPFLNLFNPLDCANLSVGLISLKDENKFDVIDDFAFNDRVSNLKKTISILDSIYPTLQLLYLETLDANILTLSTEVKNNLTALKENLKIFQTQLDSINKIINANGYESTWLTGSTEANDLQTKSASLISTDLGVANIFVKDNLDNIKYIPKFYIGLNIFFRPVNRNTNLEYLSGSKRAINKKYDNKINRIDDNLSATRSIMQHLSLSIGITLGSMNVRNFDNLFNTSSLVIGPSYRFARAFRITSGISILKRSNPNPLMSNEIVTTGLFASFSVDFDFLSTVKNFTDLFTK